MQRAGAVQQLGFVDFTTTLVRETYQVIVDASMEQLKAYGELVAAVSKTLVEYQSGVVGGTDTEREAKADDYISNVLGFELTTATPATQLTLAEEQVDALKEHFAGVLVLAKPIDHGTRMAGDKIKLGKVSATTETDVGLRTFVVAKLNEGAKQSYELLKAILKIGMQKVAVTDGKIYTRLTFHVDAQESQSRTMQDISQRATDWSVSSSLTNKGSASLGLGLGKLGSLTAGHAMSHTLAGAASGRSLRVHVVNEQSSSAINVSVDIIGGVEINFRTETFPTVE